MQHTATNIGSDGLMPCFRDSDNHFSFSHPNVLPTASTLRLGLTFSFCMPYQILKCFKYLLNADSFLIRKCVNRGGLDLSKEVLWISVGQRIAKLQAVKVGDLKKILPLNLSRIKRRRPGPASSPECLDHSQS